MRKTIKRAALTALVVAGTAGIAMATGGLTGDCYSCHTMHNSEEGLPVVDSGPQINLLRYDCAGCHANNPATGAALITLGGSSNVPQVAHGQGMNGLAGGNFTFAGADQRKGHNVIDLYPADDSNAGDPTGNPDEYGAPPGNAHASHHGLDAGVFSVSTAFDVFTCAGARGCHGTRSQLLRAGTNDNSEGDQVDNAVGGERRVGMAALSGAHHASYDGAKMDDGYGIDGSQAETLQIHDGDVVAAGYRFIPGLYGYGNETNRWQNIQDGQHNEYYGESVGFEDVGGCGTCHIQGHIAGFNSRANVASTMRVPKHSMSGFCATCHGVFHSAGDSGDTYTYNTSTGESDLVESDYVDNGVSGAFLRHPSDWTIPDRDEYSAYTAYDVSAPVARVDISIYGSGDPQVAGSSSNTVVAGTDMVMCLSCHYAHGSDQDYMLRFDYTTMTAGTYSSQAEAQAQGGCLACHTLKGVPPELRP
jgi:predicted CXXCH cytochrome family protein